MAKRFTDTDKWKRPWFKSLPLKAKLSWNYLCDECDHAGVWIEAFDIMEVQCGFKVSADDFHQWFGSKVIKVDSDKWFIPSFYEFQYKDAREGFKAKQSALKSIARYGFTVRDDGKVIVPDAFSTPASNSSEQLPNSYLTVPEQSMDSPSIGIGIGIGIGISNKEPEKIKKPVFDFESLYRVYPRHEGKAEGMKRLAARIKSNAQFELFAKAVHNYKKKTERTDPDKIKFWSSFVGTDEVEPWRDYINESVLVKKHTPGDGPRPIRYQSADDVIKQQQIERENERPVSEAEKREAQAKLAKLLGKPKMLGGLK